MVGFILIIIIKKIDRSKDKERSFWKQLSYKHGRTEKPRQNRSQLELRYECYQATALRYLATNHA